MVGRISADPPLRCVSHHKEVDFALGQKRKKSPRRQGAAWGLRLGDTRRDLASGMSFANPSNTATSNGVIMLWLAVESGDENACLHLTPLEARKSAPRLDARLKARAYGRPGSRKLRAANRQ